MKARITLTEELLGTACANKDVHEEFIASRSKDAEKMQEELESLPAEDLLEKAVTVFPRDDDGTPILYDYQVKGFLKDAMAIQVQFMEEEKKVGKSKLTPYTVRRIVDNCVFVRPRKIRLAPVSGICTRPLRAQTRMGERVCLASSEIVPAYTTFDVEIVSLAPGLNEILEKCLDYGALKGLGQWRNSGKGRFSWEKLD